MENSAENQQRREIAMDKTWHRIRPYWHIGTTILIALIGSAIGGIIWVTNVNALPQQIKDLKSDVSELQVKVQKIDIVGQRVDDIADFMGVPKRKRNHDNVEKN